MKLLIKSFDVDMEVKTKGIEIDVYELDQKQADGTTKKGDRLGDVILNKKGLTWCKEARPAAPRATKTWKEVITWMESGK